jgi:C_GCAxxG_C_C family probable redox protein
MMIKEINVNAIQKDAEALYRNGDFYCSEAIVSVIRKHIAHEMPEQAISMASGFPLGLGGAQCVCGAVSGGIMCLGYFFGRTQPGDTNVEKTMSLAKELHDYFTKQHKVLCCRVLTKGMELGSSVHMDQCISFTGEIAAKTAEIIAREAGIKIHK